jgi:hypothetical protein
VNIVQEKKDVLHACGCSVKLCYIHDPIKNIMPGFDIRNRELNEANQLARVVSFGQG